MKKVKVAGLLASCALALSAQNTSNQHMDDGANKMMKSTDMNFAMKAAQGGTAEVQLGQLAAQKASNPEVKAFGQQMVDDHTKANDDLKSVAQSESITLPASLDANAAAEYAKLQNLSGSAFDRAYVNDMLKDHEQDVKLFQKEANNGKDPQIRSFAQRTLPILESHLAKIRTIHSNVAGGGSSKLELFI